MKLQCFAEDRWFTSDDEGATLLNAVNGDLIGFAASSGVNFEAMVHHAKTVGGPNLRKLTIHKRAEALKALAKTLMEFKRAFYELSFMTGATKTDSWVDIDGGISTLFVYSSKGRRELADENFIIEGNLEQISRQGTFLGQHILVPLEGVAVHINAFNFPVWGMLEKLAPTLLAGVPAIIKPATSTSYLTEAVFRCIIDSGLLPEGAVQLICGATGDLLDHLDYNDVVSFTGSASTAEKLSTRPRILQNGVKFIAECDSLNSSILGPDATPDTPEFDLYIKEVAREMTSKAGQKCTAIRRAIVPAELSGEVIKALQTRLSKTVIGDPKNEAVRMGALASRGQRDEVRARVAELAAENEIVHGNVEEYELDGGSKEKGAFVPPILMYCDKPFENLRVHDTEAFGPVATVVPYTDLDNAIRLANMGGGSLVTSLFTHDNAIARQIVLGTGAHFGRICMINRDSAGESTGHGSPMPHLKHGGPGRAGGGEELGGIHGMKHYMQRVALQGSPEILTGVLSKFIRGAKIREIATHPFRKNFDEIEVGDTLMTDARTVTMEDVEHFANFTGDTFYAHMNEAAATRNPFFERRVAHGYLILSFAAGLFVDPDEGPVLANYGLNDLQFMTPLYPGDSMRVQLTCKQKIPRSEQQYGEVRWYVEVTNQDNEMVATYELLTLNALDGAVFEDDDG
jgi:oxepin-CoA hydrolase / 3-oxo-5,6-dehydrosuberyl-CoA semialdehyde dehydrogenase